MSRDLLNVRELRVTFHIRREGDWPWSAPRELHAVGGLDCTVAPG